MAKLANTCYFLCARSCILDICAKHYMPLEFHIDFIAWNISAMYCFFWCPYGQLQSITRVGTKLCNVTHFDGENVVTYHILPSNRCLALTLFANFFLLLCYPIWNIWPLSSGSLRWSGISWLVPRWRSTDPSNSIIERVSWIFVS